MRIHAFVIACLFGIGPVSSAYAATVWTGPESTFFKTGAEPTTVQDVLTAGVSLTRGASQFLFNPLGGDVASGPTTPTGTEWAFAGLDGNPVGLDFSASNFAALSFDTFLSSLGGPGVPGGGAAGGGIGNVILDQPGVVHLIAEDVYFDIQFLQWGSAVTGGNVEFARSTVPVPAALPLLASALGFLGIRRRRDTNTRSKGPAGVRIRAP
jgi:hypothetical protein